jgi:hypothetical protein
MKRSVSQPGLQLIVDGLPVVLQDLLSSASKSTVTPAGQVGIMPSAHVQLHALLPALGPS